MVKENSNPATKKKFKIDAKLVVRAILVVLISVVLGCGIYSMNAKLVTGDQMPMPLGIGVGVIMSGSMEPELSVDDVILVSKADDYAVGDTVVYQSHGMLIVHKIIAIDGETVITMGTANNVADDPINVSAIKGRVFTHFDGLGAIVDVIKSPLISVLILGLAAFLLVKSYTADKQEKAAKNTAELDAIRAEIAALKQNKPSPAGEGGPLAVDEVLDPNSRSSQSAD